MKDSTDTGLVVCLCCVAAGIALLAAGIATHHWMLLEVKNSSDDLALGLFKLCFKGTCVVYDDHSQVKITDDLKIIRGLCITAIIMYGFALITMLAIALTRQSIASKTSGYVAFIFCGIGGIFAIAGMAHFVKIHEDEDVDSDLYRYGYSLHLAWLSAVPVIFAGVAIVFVVRKLFERRINQTGQVINPPPYMQTAGMPFGVMTYPQTPMAYDNPVMMSNMNPGQSQVQEKQGPPPSIVGVYPGAPSNGVYGAGGIQGPPSYTSRANSVSSGDGERYARPNSVYDDGASYVGSNSVYSVSRK